MQMRACVCLVEKHVGHLIDRFVGGSSQAMVVAQSTSVTHVNLLNLAAGRYDDLECSSLGHVETFYVLGVRVRYLEVPAAGRDAHPLVAWACLPSSRGCVDIELMELHERKIAGSANDPP